MLTIENVINQAKFSISGNVHLHEGAGKPDPFTPVSPVNIIQVDQALFVHFVWTQSGVLSKLLNTSCKWECRAYLEEMGKQETDNPAPTYVNFVAVDGNTYSAYVTIPAGSLREGAYKIVATLQLNGPTGKPTPIAAYEEVGILQVYED